MVVKRLFGLVCDRLCELVYDCLWNVQKKIFRGYLDEEKNLDCQGLVWPILWPA